MIGWSTVKNIQKPIVKIYSRNASPADDVLSSALLLAHSKNNYNIEPIVLKNDFNRSDNWSFWQKNIPSICVSEDWENDFNQQNYHTENDLPLTLNYNYLGEIIKLVIGGIQELESKSIVKQLSQ